MGAELTTAEKGDEGAVWEEWGEEKWDKLCGPRAEAVTGRESPVGLHVLGVTGGGAF